VLPTARSHFKTSWVRPSRQVHSSPCTGARYPHSTRAPTPTPPNPGARRQLRCARRFIPRAVELAVARPSTCRCPIRAITARVLANPWKLFSLAQASSSTDTRNSLILSGTNSLVPSRGRPEVSTTARLARHTRAIRARPRVQPAAEPPPRRPRQLHTQPPDQRRWVVYLPRLPQPAQQLVLGKLAPSARPNSAASAPDRRTTWRGRGGGAGYGGGRRRRVHGGGPLLRDWWCACWSACRSATLLDVIAGFLFLWKSGCAGR
jgi:hypothetical protein